jgi:Tubulin/FtsZ family, GTPase domain
MLACCVGQAGNQIGAATAKRTGPLSHIDLAAEALGEAAPLGSSFADPGSAPRLVVSTRVKPSGFAFIDSEPKVVRGIVTPTAATSSASSSFLPFVSLNGSVAWDQNGRGNNWAWGYTGLAGGARFGERFATVPGQEEGGGMNRAGGKKPAGAFASSKSPLWKRAMETIRRQAEACELLDDSAAPADRGGFALSPSERTMLLTHSLGGGTGAGLGSRLLEACRDEFPKWTLLSAVVAPFACGDTPLQHYNTALALASCQEVSDGVLLFHNDDLVARAKIKQAFYQYNYQSAQVGAATAKGRIRASATITNSSTGPSSSVVSTWDCNEVMAEALSGMISPLYHRRKGDEKIPGSSGLSAAASALHSKGWVDVSRLKKLVAGEDRGDFQQRKFQNEEADDDGNKGEEEDEGKAGDDNDDDRDGWIRDSVRTKARFPSNVTSAAGAARGSSSLSKPPKKAADDAPIEETEQGEEEEEAFFDDDGSAATIFPHYFNGAAFLQQLGVGSSASMPWSSSPLPSCCKYLDLRSATNVFSPPSSSIAVLPGVSWSDLADCVSDTIPRYLQQQQPSAAPPGASRHVTTFAARIIARGASQTDCDSVDPTLPAGATTKSESSSSAVGWGDGLPQTLEWSTVGQKLSRAMNVPSGSSSQYQHHRQPYGSSQRYGISSGKAAQPVGPLLSAVLSPSLLGSPICRKDARYGDLIRQTANATPLSAALSSLNARSLTVAIHSDAFTSRLLHTVERVENLLRLRAYLHWYERFGVGSDHMRAAAETLLDAVDAYTTAASEFAAATAATASHGGAGRRY